MDGEPFHGADFQFLAANVIDDRVREHHISALRSPRLPGDQGGVHRPNLGGDSPASSPAAESRGCPSMMRPIRSTPLFPGSRRREFRQ